MPLRRLVYHSSFPLVYFLSLLFQFTFLQKSPEEILACLEVWAAVCDYLEGSKEAGKGEVIGRYTESLAALVLLSSVCNLGQKLTDRDCITLRRRAHLEPS